MLPHFQSVKNISYRVLAAAILMFVPVCGWSAQPDKPVPDIPLESNNDSGYFSIIWHDDGSNPNAIFELQQAKNKDFQDASVIYKGLDRASFISGLPNGTYYYRIRKTIDEEKSPWSETIVVHIEHHSLYLAFSLASVGLLVFVLTAGIIIKGVKKENS